MKIMNKYIVFTIAFYAILLVPVRGTAQPGSLDPSFNSDGYALAELGPGVYNSGYMTLELPDGKIMVAGYSYDTTDLSTASQTFFIRYNHDGTRDNTFGYGGLTVTDTLFHDRLLEIVLQPDGKIVGCGYSRKVGEPYKFVMIRINPDGTFDGTFGLNGLIHESGTGVSDWLYSLVLLVDGKILVRGSARGSATTDQPLLIRYNSDGSRDTTFGSDGMKIYPVKGCTAVSNQQMMLKPDGTILTGGTIYIHEKPCVGLFQYSTDGIPDLEFGYAGMAIDSSILFAKPLTFALQSSGKIVVPLRAWTETTSRYYYSIFRYNADGSPDSSFHGNGHYIGDEGWAYDIVVQPDDKFVISGCLFNDSTVKHMVVRRYLATGEPDPVFSQNGTAEFFQEAPSNLMSVGLTREGQIIATGYGLEETTPLAWRKTLTMRLNSYPAGLHEINSGLTIKISPNPFENFITIETPGISGSLIDIYSLQGQKVETLRMEGEKGSFSLGHLPAGSYILKAKSNGYEQSVPVIRID